MTPPFPCCVTCTSEGCSRVAYCVDESLPPPCRHDTGACGDCNLTVCSLCREEEMCETGEYSPENDPFHTGPASASTLPEVLDEQEAHLAPRKAESGFDPATNTYRYPKGKGA